MESILEGYDGDYSDDIKKAVLGAINGLVSKDVKKQEVCEALVLLAKYIWPSKEKGSPTKSEKQDDATQSGELEEIRKGTAPPELSIKDDEFPEVKRKKRVCRSSYKGDKLWKCRMCLRSSRVV